MGKTTTIKDQWVLSASGVAAFFKVNRSTVWEWHQKGMPKRADGKYYLPACIIWHVCFGPGRLEGARDQYLEQLIRRVMKEAP